MIPEIEFRYSRIYNSMFMENKKDYPSQEKIIEYIKEIKLTWKKYEKKALESIQKNSGLKWKEKRIIVYIVGICIPFSDPLTLMIFRDRDKFINNLIHELIHNIQTGDAHNWKKWIDYLNKKYPRISDKTKSHIFLYAIEYRVLLEIFGKKRLNEEIKRDGGNKEYKKAWEIVKKESPKKIIKKFKEITR